MRNAEQAHKNFP